MTEVAPGALRKQPVQQRSRARLAAILQTAEEIVIRDGIEGLSMRDLAIRAQVPVGSVYQYFETREAVLETIVATHGRAFESIMRGAAEASATLPWPEVIDLVVTQQCEGLRASPAYVAIWTGRALSREQQQRDDDDVDALAAALESIVARQEGLATSPRLATGCRAATQAADSLVRLAFRLDPAGDPATLAELLPMVVAYLQQLIDELRGPGRARKETV